MNKRYMSLAPEYARHAFETWYAYGANDEKLEEFVGKWGGVSYEHFKYALEQGRGDDRLCAMFALGASAHPDAARVLFPFLHSTQRDERCISAIALGMRHDTRSYPFLENLILEGVSQEERVDAFGKGDQEALQGLFLCDRFRPKAVELLETWHSPTFIQTLIQALQVLWVLEKTSSQFSVEGRTYDTLCYALGQRGVFSILDTLDFPLAYRRIAMIYVALGALQVRPEPTFMRSVLKRETSIRNFVNEKFRVDPEEAQSCIETFYQESEVRRAYRSGMDEQTIEGHLAEHFIGASDVEHFFQEIDRDEEMPEEKRIEQREPVCVCVYRGHDSAVWSLAWSPDGVQIVSGGADTTAQVWNWRTGEQTSLFRGHKACVTAVAWSPDGQWIASGGCDNHVFVWHARTGEILTTYTKHTAWIGNGLAWSPDGRYLASASWDKSVHIWEAKTGKTCLRYQKHGGVVTSVAWSPDGTQVVSGGGYPECAIHVWNASTGHLNVIYKAHMQDTEGTRPLLKEVLTTDETWARGPDSVRSLAWSPDSRWIASVGLRNVFRVWNAQTGEDLIARAQNRTNGPLTWSSDSSLLATGSQNGVDVWNIEQKSVMLNYAPAKRDAVMALAWSPDMRALVAGGEHPHVCVWEVDIA
ncbi:MAG TPA: hypothetical protein VFV38_52385 [Ktedonobacteraceae bacterium]|nr:hypothetical protein [Ktedonobacteraceae bacterium]